MDDRVVLIRILVYLLFTLTDKKNISAGLIVERIDPFSRNLRFFLIGKQAEAVFLLFFLENQFQQGYNDSSIYIPQ
ncbi:MAG: hypothetical protein LUQ54_06615 [Methanoregula sp.]|nr:hypothetical protein [Methanoregula sp.]